MTGGIACEIRKLRVLSYCTNGFTQWHYPAPVALDDVVAPGFWSPAVDLFAVGDQIMVTGPAGAVILHVAVVLLAGVSVVALAATPLALRAADTK